MVSLLLLQANHGNKPSPVTFAIIINNLSFAALGGIGVKKDDTTMFMDNTTLSEILDL